MTVSVDFVFMSYWYLCLCLARMTSMTLKLDLTSVDCVLMVAFVRMEMAVRRELLPAMEMC